MNHMILVGTATRTPEIRQVGDTTQAISFTLGGERPSGERSLPFYVQVNMIGPAAERLIKQQPKAGTPLMVEGSLEENTWGEGDKKRTVIRMNGKSAMTMQGEFETAQDSAGQPRMKGGVNRVMATGHIGKVTFFPAADGKKASLSLRVGVKENWKDKAGEWQSKTHWTDVRAWESLAERHRHLAVGSLIYFSGALENSSTGEGEEKRTFQRVTADEISLIGLKAADGDQTGRAAPAAPVAAAKVDSAEDSPF